MCCLLGLHCYLMTESMPGLETMCIFTCYKIQKHYLHSLKEIYSNSCAIFFSEFAMRSPQQAHYRKITNTKRNSVRLNSNSCPYFLFTPCVQDLHLRIAFQILPENSKKLCGQKEKHVVVC